MITLEELVKAAEQLLDADAAAALAAEDLKAANKKARVLREETIPEAMAELNLDHFSIKGGRMVTVKQEVYASIPKDNEQAAFDWLNKNDFGAIIKTEVKSSFGKGEREEALKLSQELADRGIDNKFKEGVHHSTLKAWLKEMLRDGKDVPMDLFGARPVMTARIK